MKIIFFATVLAVSLSGSFAHAAGDKSSKTKMGKMEKMEWTTTQRENMAKMHENMATCLRSNKAVNDCRAEMKTSCKDMGKEGCPMMMHDKMMHEE
ncbi:hypothetical protein [Bdellovibrio sp. BCCA]|uniref:hypothetical protein n=1 Tax=Bdellovibrio sp. BCCA TaxID=3136281 RepID=UPI0030F2C409